MFIKSNVEIKGNKRTYLSKATDRNREGIEPRKPITVMCISKSPSQSDERHNRFKHHRLKQQLTCVQISETGSS